MTTLRELAIQHTFKDLNPALSSAVMPSPLHKPFLVSANPLAAELIGLDKDQLYTESFVEIFSGQQLLANSQPIAMVYSGHQFGAYNPQLGDGRGLLLGDVTTPRHGIWDLHLKGAGQTPYSRFGDGRAVLRSSIREYLGCEAMAGLGIATTRALAIIGSETQVQRESVEKAATLLRLARTHIRFGHFEFFHYNNRPDVVKQLAEHVISQHYPQWQNDSDRNYKLLEATVINTAEMIAQWQVAGFAHGVMNTDNMSILGDTFDYGPFGFLDDFNPAFICNHSDHQGRYAFNQQPSIGLWNLNALAHALSSLLNIDQIRQALAQYESLLINRFNTLMRQKLGLHQSREGDQTLISDLLALLQKQPCDYHLFFRQLCSFDENQGQHTLRDQFIDRENFDRWAKRYCDRLADENSQQQQRHQAMKRCNPKYILRNYLAQQAIEAAEDRQDYSHIERLLLVLQSPFDEHPGYEEYAKAPPDWGKRLAISCSS